jgi:hypothetical protein
MIEPTQNSSCCYNEVAIKNKRAKKCNETGICQSGGWTAHRIDAALLSIVAERRSGWAEDEKR